jgi:hypothetical protein
MMLIGENLCNVCVHRSVAVEVRNGKTSNWDVCECNHHWFKKIQVTKQCRDFEDENKERD